MTPFCELATPQNALADGNKKERKMEKAFPIVFAKLFTKTESPARCPRQTVRFLHVFGMEFLLDWPFLAYLYFPSACRPK